PDPPLPHAAATNAAQPATPIIASPRLPPLDRKLAAVRAKEPPMTTNLLQVARDDGPEDLLVLGIGSLGTVRHGEDRVRDVAGREFPKVVQDREQPEVAA